MSRCCDCLLVDEQCLRKILGYMEYVRWEQFERFLIDIRERFIIELISPNCYTELCDAFTSNTLTPLQEEWVKHIQYYWAWLLDYFMVVDFFHTTGIGNVIEISPNTSQGGLSQDPVQRQLRAEQSLERSEFYKKRLMKFLEDNNEDISCYNFESDCRQPIRNSSDFFITSWKNYDKS